MAILLAFSVMAYIANLILDYNYMFLMNHDGTPYSIFYNLVGGSPVFYPIIVVLLFVVYVVLFYYIYHLILKKNTTRREKKEEVTL